eukprot:1172785-Rhodomonas_salina.1
MEGSGRGAGGEKGKTREGGRGGGARRGSMGAQQTGVSSGPTGTGVVSLARRDSVSQAQDAPSNRRVSNASSRRASNASARRDSNASHGGETAAAADLDWDTEGNNGAVTWVKWDYSGIEQCYATGGDVGLFALAVVQDAVVASETPVNDGHDEAEEKKGGVLDLMKLAELVCVPNDRLGCVLARILYGVVL